MKRLLFCLFSLMVLTVNESFAEERDNGTETPPSTYTDNQGIIYRLNSAGNAYTVRGHTSDFNVNVNLPSSLYGIPVTSISFNAFHGCGISSIFIPSSVENLYDGMEDNPFSACVNLTSITVASDNPWYDSREGCNAIIEKSSNSLIIGCSKSFIPNSVESIRRDAFYGSTFSDITIPENIKSIGSISFGRCNELKSFIVKSRTPFSIDEYVFDESNHNVFEYATLYVPKGCKTAYQQANVWNNFQNIVEQEEVNPENCEPYAVYQDGVLTFYYDDKKGTREGTKYELNEGYNTPGWYTDHRTDITKAVFDDSFAGARPTSTYLWFAVGWGKSSNLTEISGIQNLNTSNVTNMCFMFFGCSNLTSLDVSHFDTSNVTDMDWMFDRCSSLTNLDVSHFDTRKVTNMGSMFAYCNNLTSLDVSHFDTRSVTNMGSMFYECSSLMNLDVSLFDTGKVTDMSYMFHGCNSLTSLDVSHFNTWNVTNMGYMFYACVNLTSLDVSHFDTGNVTNLKYMFSICRGLTRLDVSHFDTSNVTDMGSMFNGCSSLKSLDVSHFDTKNVTDMNSMFSGCSSLTSLDLSHFDTGNVTNMSFMFYECNNLTCFDLRNFETDKVTNMSSMFLNCNNLTFLDVSHFDTKNVTDMTYMFYFCSKLTTIYCNDTWTCSSSTNMFYYCKNLSGYQSANITVDYAKPIDLGGYFTRIENNANPDINDFDVVYASNFDYEMTGGVPTGWIVYNEAGFHCYGFHSDGSQYNYNWGGNPGGGGSRLFDGFSGDFNKALFWGTRGTNEGYASFGEQVKDYMLEGGVVDSNMPEGIELKLKAGRYRINFLMAAWKNEPTFTFTLEDLHGNVSAQFKDLVAAPNVNGSTGKVTGSVSFVKDFTISVPGYYVLRFTADEAQWQEYLLASVKIIALSSYDCEVNGLYYNLDVNTKTASVAYNNDSPYNGSISIPSTISYNGITYKVSGIESSSFRDCSDLISISIGSNVTNIGNFAFNGCSGLTTVTVKNPLPVNIESSTFTNRSNVVLYVPIGCKAAYEAADYWKEFKEIIEMDGDNSLYADDVTVRPGIQKTITLQLDNENTFIAGEFRLQLPTGLSIETDEDGEPVANLVSGRSNKHTLMVTDEGNGVYHFMFYSGQNRAILGNSGDFISLSVIADEGVDDGSYTAKLKNAFFSTEDEKRIDLPDVDFNIVVLDYTPGDVNGDGSLNVMDVVKLVNYIMGRNPSDFVFAAADMDENGKINVMDLVNVVEVIMAAPQQAPVMGMATSSNLELGRMDKNTVSLSVPDADRHIAAQFTVTLSGNAVLKDVLSDDAHQSEVTRMSDGRYKVMVYSGRNDSFRSDSPISLQLSGNSDVKIDDVVFVDADEEAVAYEPVATNATGILSVGTEFSQPTDIYTVSGSLVKKNATSMRGLSSGVYIVNNEKVVIK